MRQLYVKRRSMVLACASVAAGLLLGTVPTASAATAAPELVAAGGSGEPSSGLLSVTARSDSPITAITAHLYASDGSGGSGGLEEVATVDGFHLGSGSDTDGRWTTTTPLRLAELDTYRVVVDLTDADRDTSTTQSTTGFAYWRTADLLDFEVAPEHPDHSHQQVSVSGRYTVTDPRTGLTAPAADSDVRLVTSNWGSPVPVRTDTDGRFTYAYTHTYDGRGLVTPDLDLTPPGQQNGATAYVTPVRSATRVLLDTDELSTVEGEPVTVSGRAEVMGEDDWEPLAGATVRALWDSDSGAAVTRPVTDSEGRFSGELLMPRSGTAQVRVLGGTYLDASGEEPLRVNVARATSVGSFTVSVGKDSRLTAQGRLYTGESTPSEGDNKVRIQYSADGATGWTTVATVVPGSADPEEGALFQGTFTAPAGQGHYRAEFAGSPNWQAAYSESVFVAVP
ncbi:hypothetical protein OHS59_23275 [Streptomyces sp. NBC_00414]|uniref:hypothetical protein n=1 Tax=Streptomyces sp. NBC_00414 TaxID=2975739 RepID=UPI002E22F9A4